MEAYIHIEELTGNNGSLEKVLGKKEGKGSVLTIEINLADTTELKKIQGNRVLLCK